MVQLAPDVVDSRIKMGVHTVRLKQTFRLFFHPHALRQSAKPVVLPFVDLERNPLAVEAVVQDCGTEVHLNLI